MGGVEITYLVLLIATLAVITGVSVYILFRLFTGQR